MPAEHVPPDRTALNGSALAEAIIRPGGLWRAIAVTGQTGSTNADLLAQVALAPEGSVLVAETQTAGRGRLDRTWQSPPGAGLTFSMLLRPLAVPPARRGWLPLLTGVAVAAAVRAQADIPAGLKWPNDVLAGPRKLAGILAEQSGQAIVVGVGLNVSTTRAELPVDTATSLLAEGAVTPSRAQLLAAILAEFERLYLAWAGGASPGDPEASGLRQAYRQASLTLGRPVRAELPGGATLTGTAQDIDHDGRLVLTTPEGPHPLSAADIIHLR
ncbi:MAG TPA: biotin--[acetyl-CoA-carboxylase] ligase [Streptosporangiaceae bacterium]|jgi:BirA family biotin operon repressor/biotin-[acetyl-CoA-carboxylase] ligase